MAVDLPPANPLGPEHLQALNDALAAVKRGREAIALAERAGIDQTAAKTALDQAEQTALRIKSVYFPGQ